MITDSRDNVDNERRRIDSLLARRVDGLIVIPVESPSSGPALEHAAGIRAVLRHLAGQGARNVAFISGDDTTSTDAARLSALERQVGVLVGPSQQHRLGSFSVEFGQKATQDL